MHMTRKSGISWTSLTHIWSMGFKKHVAACCSMQLCLLTGEEWPHVRSPAETNHSTLPHCQRKQWGMLPRNTTASHPWSLKPAKTCMGKPETEKSPEPSWAAESKRSISTVRDNVKQLSRSEPWSSNPKEPWNSKFLEFPELLPCNRWNARNLTYKMYKVLEQDARNR